MKSNPVLAEVTRNNMVESIHRGSYAIVGINGDLLASEGDITSPVFPRSAIKPMQALPLIESGAASAFGFTKAEIAVACSSQVGESSHIEAVRAMLKKAGIEESFLGCGAHWPSSESAMRSLVAAGKHPQNVHNNCSGKHTGMLATAKYFGESLENYVNTAHPVQKRIQSVIAEFCECELVEAPCGIDGCSAPNWAIPLKNLALGFAKFTNSDHSDQLSQKWSKSAATIVAAVKSAPEMVAGTNSFCTQIMKSIPRLIAKSGAEGVYCGAIPDAGIGIALKCDDGASRAAEVIFAKILSSLSTWNEEERTILLGYSQKKLQNLNGITIGELRAC